LTKDWSQERLDAVGSRVEEIRAALIEGEKNGISERSVHEIWDEARRRRAAKDKN
jgi:hypothetical protein